MAALDIGRPPQSLHQVVILDRNFFNFPREVDVLVQSLKEVLALATASRAPREPLFPSFSLLAYPSDVDEEAMLTLLAPTVLARATLHDILASLDRVLCDAPASRFADARLEWETFLEALERELPAAATAGHPNHPSHRVTYFTRAFPSTFRGDLPEGPAPWIAGVSVVGLRQSLDDPEQKWTVARERKDQRGRDVTEFHLSFKKAAVERFMRSEVFPGWISKQSQCEILLPATEFSKLALRIQCQMSPVFLSALHQGFELACESGRSTLRKTLPKVATHLNLSPLRCIAKVGTGGVCQSLTYGRQNVVVTPLQGSKVDQRRFVALSSQLLESSLMAVLTSEASSARPHFLLMPINACSMLLQSIAVSEMILPVEPWGSLGDDELELDSTNLMELETSLNQLDVIEEFNPDEISTWTFDPNEAYMKSSRQRVSFSEPSQARASRGRTRGRRRGSFVGEHLLID